MKIDELRIQELRSSVGFLSSQLCKAYRTIRKLRTNNMRLREQVRLLSDGSIRKPSLNEYYKSKIKIR